MPTPTGLFVGLATLDVIHHVDSPPGPNEKVTALATYLAAGGPAANAAVTFAALGGRAILLTALGQHPSAGLIRADLQAHGVEVIDASPDLAQAPPVSAIAVTRATGERSIIGADAIASPAQPPSNLTELISQASVVLIDGHHPNLATPAAHLASEQGIPVVIDLGRWKPVMAELVPLATDVVCSADARAPGTDSVRRSADELMRFGAPQVVVTQGADPVLWWTAETPVSEPATGTVLPPSVAAADTLGAGDAFHGAYAFARAIGHAVPEAIELGNAVATLRVQHEGPRAWLHYLSEVAR